MRDPRDFNDLPLPWFLSPKDFDPLGTVPAMQELSSRLLLRPWLPLKKGISQSIQHGKKALKILRDPQKNAPAIIGKDPRFSAEEWSEQRRFALMALTYLSWREGVLGLIEETPHVDAQARNKARFVVEQLIDILSPSNNPLLNPQVLKATRESRGENLLRGFQNFLDDVRSGNVTPKHSPDGAFIVGENIANTPGTVVAKNHLCEIIQYEPTTEKVQETPILLIPPWINKYYILDLGEKKSYVKHLLDSGHQVFCLSWKNPGAEMADTTFADYVENGALFARSVIESIAHCAQPAAIGYCLGGTLLMIAQAYAKAKKQPVFSSLTLFATMVDFCDAGDVKLFIDEQSIDHIEENMKQKGYLDGAEMTATFAYIRSRDLLWKFVVNNYYLGNDPKPYDILAWNADSTRMPAAMHSWYLRNMYLHNRLKEPNSLSLNDVPLNLHLIQEDIYVVAAELDHIAPAESVYQIHRHTDANIRYVLGSGGHLAGIVHKRPSRRGYFYTHIDPNARSLGFSEWKQSASRTNGSWWHDHEAWLRARTGDAISAANATGNTEFPPIGDAPGTYVFEK